MPNALASIFTPITPQAIELIQNDTLCLQSPFFLNKNGTQEINVSLTNLYLAIFQPQ